LELVELPEPGVAQVVRVEALALKVLKVHHHT
jgi:hypothetical protein